MSIKVGSKVYVQWDNLVAETCIVKYMPCATGDCWIFEKVDGMDGEPMGIEIMSSYFAKMTELTPNP